MSKLAKAINVQTNKLSGFEHIGSVKHDWKPLYTHIKQDMGVVPTNFGIAKKYAIRTTFGAEVVIDEFVHGEKGIYEAVKNTRRAVVEEIFGEFRPRLNELRMALYDKDPHKALDILAQLELQMFYEGIDE